MHIGISFYLPTNFINSLLTWHDNTSETSAKKTDEKCSWSIPKRVIGTNTDGLALDLNQLNYMKAKLGSEKRDRTILWLSPDTQKGCDDLAVHRSMVELIG